MAERETGLGKNLERGVRYAGAGLALVAGLMSIGRLNWAVAAADFLIAYIVWPKSKQSRSNCLEHNPAS